MQKFFLVSFFLFCSLLSTCSMTSASSPQTPVSTNAIISIFEELAQIPRPSKHEEQISSYLYNWAKSRGLAVRQDKVGNITIDKPAAAGLEHRPLIILQGHMDMVCVGKEDLNYSPVNDPIKVINNGQTLTAAGTSLGADDGIGVAMILYILESDIPHGPLRAIFTVDEETSMYGVHNITAEQVQDAKYLINLDAEQSDTLINSSAGALIFEHTAVTQPQPASKQSALHLSISGLSGGHSGVDINRGRLSAIKALSTIMARLDANGIAYEISHFNGGTAANAIPNVADALILIDPQVAVQTKRIIAETTAQFQAAYALTEPAFTLTVEEAAAPDKVLNQAAAHDLLNFALLSIDGVHTMSAALDNFVQSSSNLGIIKADTSQICINTYSRSSVPIILEQLRFINQNLAEFCHLSSKLTGSHSPWPIKTDSKLIPLAAAIYKSQTHTDMKIIPIHAGLECSEFSLLNPQLDIISIGANISDVHTTRESVDINSIAITFNLLSAILNSDLL